MLSVVETTTARCWSLRLSAPGEIEAANSPYRREKGTVLLGGDQMFDSLAIDPDGHTAPRRSSAAWQRHLVRRRTSPVN
jgi:hypothetical protein